MSVANSLHARGNAVALTTVLDSWYAKHSAIRHLWALQDSAGIRVLVMLAPTVDGDDTLPVWFANGREWRSDLQAHTSHEVTLELVVDPIADVNFDAGSALIAELSWRDPSLFV